MNRHVLALAAAGAAAATLGTGGFAQLAQSPVDEFLEVVDYADLDISDPTGGARLHARIIEAAEAACDDPEPRFSFEVADRTACFRAAIQGAVNRLDQPMVTRRHLERFSWAVPPGTTMASELAARP